MIDGKYCDCVLRGKAGLGKSSLCCIMLPSAFRFYCCMAHLGEWGRFIFKNHTVPNLHVILKGNSSHKMYVGVGVGCWKSCLIINPHRFNSLSPKKHVIPFNGQCYFTLCNWNSIIDTTKSLKNWGRSLKTCIPRCFYSLKVGTYIKLHSEKCMNESLIVPQFTEMVILRPVDHHIRSNDRDWLIFWDFRFSDDYFIGVHHWLSLVIISKKIE